MKEPVNLLLFRLGVAVLFVSVISLQTAALEVSDTLSGGTWTINDSPIKVVGNLILPDETQLTIEPGVRVEFTGPYQFIIEGVLVAEGDRHNRIVFTAEHPDMAHLRWKGIRFVNGDRGSKLIFCDITYGWARYEDPWPENCGGGIYLEGSSPEIRSCYIAHNWAARDGGGIYAMFSTSLMKNNLIVDNICENHGGGLFVSYSEPTIMNCTVAHDTAYSDGGGIFIGAEGSPWIINNIISHNNQNFAWVATSLSVTFSNIPGFTDPLPGPGNRNVDPVFVNVTDHPYDYHLRLDSPCIDTGDPEMNPAEEPDVLVNRINMGAYGGTVEAALSVPVIYNYLDSLGVPVRFDSIRTGSLASKEITIENRGHYRLFIQDFDFTSDAFSPDMVEVEGLLVPEYSVEPIEPGENAKYAINFIPDSLKTYNDTLTIYSSATHQPPLKLRLIGTGIDPKAALEDTLLNFGNRQIDLSHTGVVRITNVGSSALRFSSIRIQGDGFDAEISDAHEVLEPDETGDVTITFSPTRPENYEASISLRNNDRDLVVVVKGKGVGPKMVIDDSTLFMGYVYAHADNQGNADGDTSTYTVRIANEGSNYLFLLDVNSTNSAIFSLSIPDNYLVTVNDHGRYVIQPEGFTCLGIPAGDSLELPIHFHPSSPGDIAFEAFLNISGFFLDTIAFDLSDIDTLSLTSLAEHTVTLGGVGMLEPGKYVFGDVGGETWEKLEGTKAYVVLDSVYVLRHEKLRIAPGATILFNAGAKMLVEGEFRAVGLPDDSIKFMPRDPSGTDASRWNGIFLYYEDATRLSYCVIEGSVGGIAIIDASPLIQFCTISNNQNDSLAGGGIFLRNSGASIVGCTIEDNMALAGAGICAENSIPVINNCIIRNNSAEIGGGITLRFLSSALMQSNLIYGNTWGAIAIQDHSSPRLINNTITDNSGWGIFAVVRSVPVLINTILWNNGATELDIDESSNALVSYCDIKGGFMGTKNLDVDPLFEDAAPEDYPYRLSEGSLLIDAGNPEYIYRDHFIPPSLGTDTCDIGAYGGPLGGSWTIPDVSITLFQNPAFPHWLDIFVTSLDAIREVPTCSLELGTGSKVDVPLSPNPADEYIFMGSYEALGSGMLFITVDADLAGKSQRVSRTYELNLLKPGGGTIQMAGVDGKVTLPSGSYDRVLTVLTGFESEPIKPSNGKVFISPLFFIRGMDEPLNEFCKLNVKFNADGWVDADLKQLGVYRLEGGNWREKDIPPGEFDILTVKRDAEAWMDADRRGVLSREQIAIYSTEGDNWFRLEGGYDDGVVTGKLDRGGCFAIAWDSDASPYMAANIPQTTDLIRAYPNPFNDKVSIEFNLERKTDIQLAVYDLGGRRIVDLIDQTLPAGNHIAVWNGRMENGVSLPSGIYWARLEGVKDSCLVKLLLLR